MALSSNLSAPADTSASNGPSPKRKRLYLLYLVNDLLHHGKVHNNDASVVGKFQSVLMALFGNAASFNNSPKQLRKLQDLLNIWSRMGYYSEDYIEKLREAIQSAANGNAVDGTSQSMDDRAAPDGKKGKAPPFVMPAMHGDSSVLWYDMPAGNMMPHVIPNSTRPINPASIKPLRFVAGPADESLITAVKAFLKDAEIIFGVAEDEISSDEINIDVDELGQPIVRDAVGGDVVEGEGYYGWSQQFCEKMKHRRKGRDGRLGREDKSRSRSRSSSLDQVEFKRRRYSSSEEESRSRSRGRSYNRFTRADSRSISRGKRTTQNSVSKGSSPRRDMRFADGSEAHDDRGSHKPFGQAPDQQKNHLDSQFQNQSRHPHFVPPPPPPIGSQGQQFPHFIPLPPSLPTVLHGLQFPNFIPPPPGQWQHGFPPPPPPLSGYDQHTAPPPPPFNMSQNPWPQTFFGQIPRPPANGGTAGWQPPQQQHGDSGNVGQVSGSRGSSGRGAYNQHWQGRGQENSRGGGY